MNHSFPWLFPDSFKIPWLFPDFLTFFQNSLTFPWLEKVVSFFQVFQVFQCRWEPCCYCAVFNCEQVFLHTVHYWNTFFICGSRNISSHLLLFSNLARNTTRFWIVLRKNKNSASCMFSVVVSNIYVSCSLSFADHPGDFQYSTWSQAQTILFRYFAKRCNLYYNHFFIQDKDFLHWYTFIGVLSFYPVYFPDDAYFRVHR